MDMLHEVRQVTHYNKVDPGRTADKQRMFCKRHHALEKLSDLGMREGSKCLDCPYFGGTEQGDVLICIWDDVSPARSRVLYPDQQQNEFLAVSGYIDEGYLKKG